MTKISVRIIPNAAKSEVVGLEGKTWKIRISSPPIEGRANDALVRFLADKLDIAPSCIEILKGQTSKIKILSVPMNEEDISTALETSK